MSPSRLFFHAFSLLALLGVGHAGELRAPTQANPAPAVSPSPRPGGENDAEKHVRRTACLKDARAHKLVGAQRTAYVHSCLGNATT